MPQVSIKAEAETDEPMFPLPPAPRLDAQGNTVCAENTQFHHLKVGKNPRGTTKACLLLVPQVIELWIGSSGLGFVREHDRQWHYSPGAWGNPYWIPVVFSEDAILGIYSYLDSLWQETEAFKASGCRSILLFGESATAEDEATSLRSWGRAAHLVENVLALLDPTLRV